MALVDCGAPGRIRTCDTRFRKPMLYPLSYEGLNSRVCAGSSVFRGSAFASLACPFCLRRGIGASPRRPRVTRSIVGNGQVRVAASPFRTTCDECGDDTRSLKPMFNARRCDGCRANSESGAPRLLRPGCADFVGGGVRDPARIPRQAGFDLSGAPGVFGDDRIPGLGVPVTLGRRVPGTRALLDANGDAPQTRRVGHGRCLAISRGSSTPRSSKPTRGASQCRAPDAAHRLVPFVGRESLATTLIRVAWSNQFRRQPSRSPDRSRFVPSASRAAHTPTRPLDHEARPVWCRHTDGYPFSLAGGGGSRTRIPAWKG